jgi:hypothetical protein
MAQIPIIGSEGKPILYAYLDDEGLHFQFEYYGDGENSMDYEFIHTVAPADYASIAHRFELDSATEILTIIQQITEMGRGEELKAALTDKEITNELFTWMS